MIPDTFAGGIIWTLIAFGVGRFLVELHRCQR